MTDLPLKESNLPYVAAIVAAYVSHNSLSASDLPGLIVSVQKSLEGIDAAPEAPQEPQKPAVQANKSVTADFIICLEDGLKFKSLKRHLRTKFNLSPEEYRKKWNLAADYPMVAPNYSETRSKLAKDTGLGRGRTAK